MTRTSEEWITFTYRLGLTMAVWFLIFMVGKIAQANGVDHFSTTWGLIALGSTVLMTLALVAQQLTGARRDIRTAIKRFRSSG